MPIALFNGVSDAPLNFLPITRNTFRRAGKRAAERPDGAHRLLPAKDAVFFARGISLLREAT